MTAEPITDTAGGTLKDGLAVIEALVTHARTDGAEAVAELSTLARESIAAMDRAVTEARRQGVSWDDVALAAGMSRAAARQRWGAVADRGETPSQNRRLDQRGRRSPDRGGLV